MNFRDVAVVIDVLEEAAIQYITTVNKAASEKFPRHADHLAFMSEVRKFVQESDTSAAETRYLLSLLTLYEQSSGITYADRERKK